MSPVLPKPVIGLLAAGLGLAALAGATPAAAADLDLSSGKLLLTQGISNIEGAGGGGLASWATISGYETRDGIAGNLHATYVDLPGYALRDYGAAVGLYDRLELSLAREAFDTGESGAKLGLGKGFVFPQTIVGAKLRLIGDAIYDQDSWLPQIAAGVQLKKNDRDAIVHAVGARSDFGADYYLAATKILLDQSLVVDATVRMTKANQTGLLGFGGDRDRAYHPQFEGSLGYLITRRLVAGVELRTKPDNLGFAREDDWFDLFAAYALNKHLSLTAAYVDLGSIATMPRQRGLFVSLQAGF